MLFITTSIVFAEPFSGDKKNLSVINYNYSGEGRVERISGIGAILGFAELWDCLSPSACIRELEGL